MPPASTAIIGHRLWQQHFDSDPSILGGTIRLNNRVFDVIGVAPPDFVGATRTVAASLWLPIDAQELLRASPAVAASGEGPWLGVMARLRQGVSLGEAQAELDTRARSVFETAGGDRRSRRTGCGSRARTGSAFRSRRDRACFLNSRWWSPSG